MEDHEPEGSRQWMMLDAPRRNLSPRRETLPRKEQKSSLDGWMDAAGWMDLMLVFNHLSWCWICHHLTIFVAWMLNKPQH